LEAVGGRRIFFRYNQLTVADDGCGIPRRVFVGVGLAGIRERMRELNGALEITAQGGTVIRASLPLSVAAAEPHRSGAQVGA
jgi:glucose-6-phosphate-specific signal transduction histidine kinase